MPLAERMKLAEGRPLPRKMMAAMGPAGLRQVRLRLQGLCEALFTRKRSS
jgi:hypothetical protein